MPDVGEFPAGISLPAKREAGCKVFAAAVVLIFDGRPRRKDDDTPYANFEHCFG